MLENPFFPIEQLTQAVPLKVDQILGILLIECAQVRAKAVQKSKKCSKDEKSFWGKFRNEFG